MQNCHFQSCRQGAALPLDPDSVMIPSAQTPPQPAVSPLVQVTPPGGEAVVVPVPLSENSGPPTQPACEANGLCLPQSYPDAKANAENERYARIIRNSFAGRESALTAMMTYLYQAIRFGDCADDLRETLWGISVCKMYHMRLLGELLMSLGGDPKYFYCAPPNASSGTWWSAQPAIITYSKNLGDALKSSIEAEKACIEEHQSALNYVDDEGVCALLKRIVLDEEYHLKILSELHKRFCS